MSTQKKPVKLAHGMGRKPADIAAAKKYGNQDSIWLAIRNIVSEFTKADISCWLVKHDYAVNDETVYSYLVRLKKGGYLKSKKTPAPIGGACSNVVYTLINDIGVEAPRLRKDGSLTMQGLVTENLWRSMKMLSSFDYNDLLLAANTEYVRASLETTRTYILHLHAAGYLALIKKSKGGHSASRYRLLKSKNTGPRPPQIQRTKRVYDPNLQKIMWNEDEELLCQ